MEAGSTAVKPVGDASDLVSPTGVRRDGPDRRRPAWRVRLSQLDVKVTPYVFISPFFLLFLLVGMFPLGYTAWVSVHDWGLLSGQGDYTGLDNYRRVLEDRYFWNALRNTFSIFVLSSVPQVLIALALAGLLDTQGLGGSDRQYQTLTMYLWELGWRVRDLGMASAVAWLLFLIIVVFALVNLLVSRRAGSLKGHHLKGVRR